MGSEYLAAREDAARAVQRQGNAEALLRRWLDYEEAVISVDSRDATLTAETRAFLCTCSAGLQDWTPDKGPHALWCPTRRSSAPARSEATEEPKK